jgi:hypothetical protein
MRFHENAKAPEEIGVSTGGRSFATFLTRTGMCSSWKVGVTLWVCLELGQMNWVRGN